MYEKKLIKKKKLKIKLKNERKKARKNLFIKKKKLKKNGLVVGIIIMTWRLHFCLLENNPIQSMIEDRIEFFFFLLILIADNINPILYC